MKFRSPTDEPVHVALTNGLTAQVTPEGVDLDPVFHREAIARGCVPATLTAADVTAMEQRPADPVFDRKAVIAKAIQDMLDGTNPDDFKKDGTPNMRQVSRRVGFQVHRDEVDAAWAAASKGE